MSADSKQLKEDDEIDRDGSEGGSYKERIMGELRSLVNDAERLFRQAAESSSDSLSGMRSHFDRRLERTRDRLDRTRRLVGDNARVQTEAARGYVRENPLASIGVATAAGVIVGLLVVSILNSRRS